LLVRLWIVQSRQTYKLVTDRDYNVFNLWRPSTLVYRYTVIALRARKELGKFPFKLNSKTDLPLKPIQTRKQ